MGLFGKKQQVVDPAVLAEQQRLKEQQEVHAAFQKGVTALRDFIAPSSIEFSSSYFQIGTRFARTYYIYGYPRQVYTGWLSGMVNIDEIMDMLESTFTCLMSPDSNKDMSAEKVLSGENQVYRDQEYVKAEVEKLATQLKEIEDWVKLEKQMTSTGKE